MIIKPKIATGPMRALLDAWQALHDSKAAYNAAEARLTAVLDQIQAEDRSR